MTSTSPAIAGISHVDLSVTDLDRSETFYSELLGMTRLLEGRSDENGCSARYLVHPASMVILGLVQHDETNEVFSERQIGLDHLSFSVATSDELEIWSERLGELGIVNSGITEQEMWDVLVFRDPDNIQLELFFMKPEAGALLAP